MSFDGKIVERSRKKPSFCRSVPLIVVVLLDGICSIGSRGGGVGGHHGGTVSVCDGYWWHWLVVLWWLLGVSVFIVFVTLVGYDCFGGCWCVSIGGVCNVFFKIYA